jgi:CheY-like chemotaxis protein
LGRHPQGAAYLQVAVSLTAPRGAGVEILAAAGTAASAAETMDGAAPSILVCDDSAVDCKFVMHTLEKGGYTAVGCSSGVKALELLDAGTYDLLLIDVNMRPLSGFDVLTALRQRPHLAGMPVVMMSSDSQEKRIVRCVRAAAGRQRV